MLNLSTQKKDHVFLEWNERKKLLAFRNKKGRIAHNYDLWLKSWFRAGFFMNDETGFDRGLFCV